MKSLLIHGKLDLREEEVPTPEPMSDEVRIRMAYAGICGSDLHYYFEGANGAFVVKEPLAPGHEVSGEIDLDPSGEFAPGTAVTIHPATFGTLIAGLEGARHLWPGGAYLGSASTWPHTQGGASEFLVVKKSMLRVLPSGVDLKVATLAEPLAVGLHAIAIGGGVSGKKVLVSGSGPIGLLAAAAAVAQGASEVVASDVIEPALARARALGVTGTILIGKDEMPENYFDLVLECSGVAPALSSAIVAVARRGVIVQVGMLAAGPQPIAIAPLVSKEVQLRGTFRFNDEIDAALLMLAAHPQLSSTITHTYPASEAVTAFEVAKDSKLSGKVLIELWR
jgi:L-idonate 5-dehydrogenase